MPSSGCGGTRYINTSLLLLLLLLLLLFHEFMRVCYDELGYLSFLEHKVAVLVNCGFDPQCL